MGLRVQDNSLEACQPSNKTYRWFGRQRISTKIVWSSTREASSLEVGITLWRFQLITLISLLPHSMLSRLRVSSLNFLRKKHRTFWRSSRVTTSKWLLRYRSWISVSSFLTQNSSNRDDLERHHLMAAEASSKERANNNLKMHRLQINKISRTFKLKTMIKSFNKIKMRRLICKSNRRRCNNKWTTIKPTKMLCDVNNVFRNCQIKYLGEFQKS